MNKHSEKNNSAFKNISLAVSAISAAIFFIYTNYYVSDSSPETKARISQSPSGQESEQYVFRSLEDIEQEIRRQYSQAKFKTEIEGQIQGIRTKFKNADLVERIVLEREAALLETKSDKVAKSYLSRIKMLAEVYQSLDVLNSLITKAELNQVRAELIRGNTASVDKLFARLEREYVNLEKDYDYVLVAETVFQRGRIAHEHLNYRKAYQFYRKAVQFNPYRIQYMLAAGEMSDHIALYNNAVKYYEQALTVYREGEKKSPEELRRIWLGLGNAWRGKGDMDKAIKFYESALAGDEKSFGLEHVNIAMDYNLLGLAWEGKSEIKRAKEYFQRAEKIYKQVLGESHPAAISAGENLKRVTQGAN